MIYPDEKKFLELARQGNLIPVSREILADTETPVSAYLKLAAQPAGADRARCSSRGLTSVR